MSEQRRSLELRAATADLRRYPAEATLIIRLGAVANAMHAILRGHNSTKSLASIRDQVHITSLMASLAVEASRIASEETNEQVLWPLAERGLPPRESLPTMKLDELRALLKKDSQFVKDCAEIRDRHNFHVDAPPVNEWLDKHNPDDTIVLQTVEEKTFASCLFDASAQVLGSSLPRADEDPEFAQRLLRLGTDLPSLVHSLIQGFGRLPGVRLRPRDAPTKPAWNIAVLPLDPSQHGGATVAIQVNSGDRIWKPFFFGIPASEVPTVKPRLCFGSASSAALSWQSTEAPLPREYFGWWIRCSTKPAAPGNEHHLVVCAELPSAVVFGQVNGEQHNIVLMKQWSPRRMNLPKPPKVI